MLIRIWIPFACVLGFLVGCNRQPEHVLTVLTGETMGTTYTVKLTDLPMSIDDAGLQTLIQSTLDEVDNAMSTYKKDSELSLLNRNRNVDNPITLSAELALVLAEAERIGQLSGGAYDVTVGPLVNLWGFGPDERRGVPSETEIRTALTAVGWDKIELDFTNRRLWKRNPDVYIDLSSIAKGYAVDRVARKLENAGAVNYMIEVGGELRLRGINPQGEAWRIAVEKPLFDSFRVVERVLQFSNAAMATSGDYRNFMEDKDRRYSHTIDPKSGLSVRHNLASVTVIAAECMTADAWATALMAMGPEQGYRLALKQDLAAFFILRVEGGFEEKMTPAFERYRVKEYRQE